ncbi:glycosyltransferase [Sphingomonas sp. H39-1-10]|uniref:CgeB family protein n=1 Tax=Sphingomonas pollutisoli TaxID=3030829 RepID=UPI0023B9517B|nr:glycosyltransferase [Sphingomonas pollutisoli]MDF0490995.1 glycosyltransferase [Sphingomonas pollutisoli]
MNIVFVGTANGTARHRVEAMRRLGHKVSVVDPRPRWAATKFWRSYIFQTSAFGLQLSIAAHLEKQISAAQPDLIWVNQGEYMGPKPIQVLKARGSPLVCYLNDDPFAGGIRSRRFRNFRKVLTSYDLVSVVRDENEAEMRAAGARKVIRVRMSADEVAHAPFAINPDTPSPLKSDVSFIGTWFPERGPFLLTLVRAGVPLSIWGTNWEKAPEWEQLRPHFRGSALDPNHGYSEAVAWSKVSLGLLSKENRDTHTTRSIEIPAIGGLLCAERTKEHLTMYREDIEAVFWADADECARKCHALLADDSAREAIRLAGQRRALTSGYLNEAVIETILQAVPS